VPTILQRGAQSLLLFWLVVTLTFLLTRLAPGDPTELLIAPTASREDIARLRESFGLDASLPAQYAQWLRRVATGDLGTSFATSERVSDVLSRSLPVSLVLGGVSLLLTFVIGVSVGLWQAARHGRLADTTASVVGIAVFAAPAYWISLALVALFTYGAARWGWPEWLRLPAMGMESPGGTYRGWARAADMVRHAVLPVTVLTAIGAAGIARYARAAAIELTSSDWVRTARAKGLRARVVMQRHVLANARAPLIVLFALSLPGTIAGSVFVESVFAWPGMGRTMLSSIAARDYPVVMGATLVYAAMVILANWLSDLALEWSDPRRRT
jgi:peptide/nickel transport system permease protein